MILVTGATGHVGAEVVKQLVAKGLPVRAMTRRPAAFTDPALRNRTLELSGPQALTPEHELEIVGEILGRRLTLVEPTTEQTIDGMVRGGMGRDLAEKMIEHVLSGDYGADISPVVEQVLGRRPTTFRRWAEKHFKEES